jgi:transketolase
MGRFAGFIALSKRAHQPFGTCGTPLENARRSHQLRELPANWDPKLPDFPADAKGLATRDSSGKVLNAIALHYPWPIGGAADLSPSTKTRLLFEGAGDLEADTVGGRNMHFGIREHAMGRS